MKLVYIAGPYTSNPCENTNSAVRIADGLYHESHEQIVPIIPHLNTLWDVVIPHSYEFWIAYDLQIMSRCDAVLRIPGPSPGGDGEVKRAIELGIPVFTTIEGLLRWAEQSEERDALPG